MTARDACIIGDLSTAEELLTQEIHTDANLHTSYVNVTFVMGRKHDWDYDTVEVSYTNSLRPTYEMANFHSRHSPSAFGLY
jgi:hypothetical protein